MKRKEFVKSSSLAIAGTVLSPLISCQPKKSKEPEQKTILERRNWGRNIIFKAKNYEQPSSVQELQELMRKAGNKKALGSTHSYNNIADSPVTQISLRKLNKIISIDETNSTVTIEGGIRYEDLVPRLYESGFALHNMASLPQVTVAGACSTGTHGSGTENGSLATAARGMEICSHDGQLINLSRENNPDIFDGVVVSLGGLGIITRMVLDVEPAYDVRQDVFHDMPFENAVENFDEIMSSGYSVSLFHRWQNDTVGHIWVKRRMDQPLVELGAEFFGGRASEQNANPTEDFFAKSNNTQIGVPGPWYDRIPHFRINAMPSEQDELQSEYFLPVKNAGEAMHALAKLGSKFESISYVSEVRTVAADNLWMSPCYKQDSVAIHFTWKSKWSEVKKLLPLIEAALTPFSIRPHWAKLHTIKAKTIQASYERFPEFLELLRTYDPKGKFRNAYLDSNIYS